ncbi:hypothetical protein QQY79_04595 [Flavobacterium tructae]|uniref:hypothetical protein n=1 Tax=Flavobacterium tructae TaxID=1114873 RepID=UPI002551F91A|nr:hypothetical protein [Flavobacterium tructae]MDL2141786.1 hypothetical protein [Flavobacterium tructae]
MEEVFIDDKEKYLKENYPFGGKPTIPELTSEIGCYHCNNIYKVGDYKVFLEEGIEYISCPSAPKCDGTIMDWFTLG